MDAGIISLRPLYQFVKRNPGPEALNGRSGPGREFAALVAETTQPIAASQGFYLWGFYDNRGLWHNRYLGKAGFGKTAHLRSRISEELRDERCCLWHSVMSEAQLFEAGQQHYPTMWHRYEGHWRRALRKADATHIVWVADPDLSNSQVGTIESDLIETLNPTANRNRPVPPIALQAHTHKIIGCLRQAIHGARETRYYIRGRQIAQ